MKPIISLLIFLLTLASCTSEPETSAPPTPLVATATTSASVATARATATAVPQTDSTPIPQPPSTPTSSTPPAEQELVVAFVKDGDIQLWNETSNQSETILSGGDVVAVTMSDDGQMIAFLRRSIVQRTDIDWFEQSALWVVERNGENAHELVSTEDLRLLLNAGESDSTDVAQIQWIPGRHQLLFSGMKYSAQGEGASHAVPAGVYLVDADAGTDTVLAPADNSLRFAPSPDGRQIALMSHTGLGFMDAEGGNWVQDVLEYPQVGVPIPIFPHGIWTQDARAFVIAAPIESESPAELNYTIWRVPLDGSPAESLATITDDSHPASVTFSPDGKRAAFYKWPEPAWLITSLASEVGPLDIGSPIELGYANLHWSPNGAAYALPDTFSGSFSQLCPEAEQNTDVCGEPIELGGQFAAIQWVGDEKFLYMTREPYSLSLGRIDGSTTPIVTWSAEEWPSLGSMSAALMAGER